LTVVLSKFFNINKCFSAPNLVRLSLILFLENEKSLSSIVFGAGINYDKTVTVRSLALKASPTQLSVPFF
jgi:hypothetical protein